MTSKLHDFCKGMSDSTDELARAIAGGADVNSVDDSGRTPLQLAAYWGNVNQVRLLLKSGAAPDRALEDAIFGRRPKVLQDIIDFGADLGSVDDEGRNVLHRASVRAYPEVVEVLLNAEMDVNCIDSNGLVPLHLCTTKREPQMGDCRINRYGEINVPYDGDFRRDTAELLLSKGADPNIKGLSGKTPLHTAFEQGAANAAALMVASGADLHSLDQNSVSPYMASLNCGYGSNADFLEEYVAFPLHLAALAGGQGLLIPSIYNSLSPSQYITAGGQTALHFAVYYTYEILPLASLIELQGNLDAADQDGDTPLHGAAECGHAAQVALLLDSGANQSVKNISGLTPLESALQKMAEENIPMPDNNLGDQERELNEQTEQYHQVLTLLGKTHDSMVGNCLAFLKQLFKKY